MTITLYGSALSLYTGKPRSYFIKAGLAYRETTPTTQHYADVVLPQAGGRRGIPVIETSEKQVIRDSTAIIDHYEVLGDHEFSYRWDYPEENHAMLKYHFGMMVPEGMDRESTAENTMGRMKSAGQGFGAIPPAFATIEGLYETLLDKLSDHFSLYPYFLGNKPSIGDFGMMAPLYAHLGRDPAPLALMQRRAVPVFRWVERMNRPEPDQGEYANQTNDYLPEDSIPETLIEVLRQIAIDFMPETRAASAVANEWLANQSDLADGDTAKRAIGTCDFEAAGQSFTAIVQPYRFYLLQRLFDYYDGLGSEQQSQVNTLLDRCDMSGLLDLGLSHRIGRANNLEVWLVP